MKRKPGVIIGAAPCPVCGATGTVKTSKNGFAYLKCKTGCDVQQRGEPASLKLMEHVTSWTEEGRALLEPGELERKETPAPPVRKPAKTPPAPSAPTPAKTESWWDKPI